MCLQSQFRKKVNTQFWPAEVCLFFTIVLTVILRHLSGDRKVRFVFSWFVFTPSVKSDLVVKQSLQLMEIAGIKWNGISLPTYVHIKQWDKKPCFYQIITPLWHQQLVLVLCFYWAIEFNFKPVSACTMFTGHCSYRFHVGFSVVVILYSCIVEYAFDVVGSPATECIKQSKSG